MRELALEISQSEPKPGVTVLTLAGRVLISTRPERLRELSLLAMEHGARAIIFDLSSVSHADSTGIGQFIATLNAAMPKGVKILLAGAVTDVKMTFRLTRLDTVFPMFETLDAAIASVN